MRDHKTKFWNVIQEIKLYSEIHIEGGGHKKDKKMGNFSFLA